MMRTKDIFEGNELTGVLFITTVGISLIIGLIFAGKKLNRIQKYSFHAGIFLVYFTLSYLIIKTIQHFYNCDFVLSMIIVNLALLVTHINIAFALIFFTRQKDESLRLKKQINDLTTENKRLVDKGSQKITINNNNIQTCFAPYDYAKRIVDLEENAKKIDRILKRISVIFKSDDLIEHLAIERFGHGSESIDYYIQEHKKRRNLFLANLKKGTIKVREIYNTDELIRYAKNLTHGKIEISKEQAKKMIENWIEVILKYPKHYNVCLTNVNVPFKYQIINAESIVMHESIETGFSHRLNSFIINQSLTAKIFEGDFETIWSNCESKYKDNIFVAAWIRENLISIL